MRTIHLVSGVSNAGKSTFIRAQIERGEWRREDVVMAYEIAPGRFDPHKPRQVIHYNLLRGLASQAGGIKDFLGDPALTCLLQGADQIRAVVLTASRATLLERCANRTSIEPWLRELHPLPYPSVELMAALRQVDLPSLYVGWCALLERSSIPIELVRSEHEFERGLTMREALQTLH